MLQWASAWNNDAAASDNNPKAAKAHVMYLTHFLELTLHLILREYYLQVWIKFLEIGTDQEVAHIPHGCALFKVIWMDVEPICSQLVPWRKTVGDGEKSSWRQRQVWQATNDVKG